LRSKKPIKKVGKFIKEETKRVLEEVETQVIGGDSVRSQSVEKERDVDDKEMIKEEERKSQLAAARRRLKEIKEEMAAARQEISQERKEKRKIREGEEESKEEPFSSVAPDLLSKSASKPKSHMPPQIGVERRKKI